MVTKEDQVKFYAEELKELEFSVKKTWNATGVSLFQNGDVYVGQYRGLVKKEVMFLLTYLLEKANMPQG